VSVDPRFLFTSTALTNAASRSDVASVDGFSLGGGPGLSPAPSPLPNALNSFFGNLQHQVRGPQWSPLPTSASTWPCSIEANCLSSEQTR